MTSSKQVTIYGKKYTLKSASSTIPPQDVAVYVDEKMKELSNARGKTSTIDLAVLTALNIAQELLELKQDQGERSREEERRLDGLLQKLENEVETLKTRASPPPR